MAALTVEIEISRELADAVEAALPEPYRGKKKARLRTEHVLLDWLKSRESAPSVRIARRRPASR